MQDRTGLSAPRALCPPARCLRRGFTRGGGGGGSFAAAAHVAGEARLVVALHHATPGPRADVLAQVRLRVEAELARLLLDVCAVSLRVQEEDGAGADEVESCVGRNTKRARREGRWRSKASQRRLEASYSDWRAAVGRGEPAGLPMMLIRRAAGAGAVLSQEPSAFRADAPGSTG